MKRCSSSTTYRAPTPLTIRSSLPSASVDRIRGVSGGNSSSHSLNSRTVTTRVPPHTFLRGSSPYCTAIAECAEYREDHTSNLRQGQGRKVPHPSASD